MKFVPVLLASAIAIAFVHAGEPEVKQPEIKKGDLDAKGNLIVNVFRGSSSGKPLPQVMEEDDDYGYTLYNAGDWDNPKPRIEIFIRKAKKIEVAGTVEELRRILKNLPKGAMLQEYDKCLVPSAAGNWKGPRPYVIFEREVKKLGLKVSEDAHTICTCDGPGPLAPPEK